MAKVIKKAPRRISVLYPLPNTTNENKEKQRVAAYCRVSTGSNEQLESYKTQVKHYDKHIKNNPDYSFVGIYADEGISGTDLRKRNAFNKMLQDCREGKIDMIITKSLSRFGRNTLDCLNSIRELKSLGVDVYFEKENIHTINSDGELLITLISAVVQQESQAQSENVKWGIRRKYEMGNIKSIPSGKFLGYDKDEEGNLIINEKQANIVRRIYNEFLSGFGTYQIAKGLTSEKIPMVHGGKEWCPSHIKKVLTNEKIKGDTNFQKTYNTDYLTKRRAKNNGELPQYYLENTHPAIIDKVTWVCVQLELKRQTEFAKKHKMARYNQHSEKIPLSGKIICPYCGHTMCLRKGVDGKYWRCTKGKSNCSNNIRLDSNKASLAFIFVWNELCQNKDHYEREWKQNINGNNILLRYRTKELLKHIKDLGKIEKMPYELMLKTLSHIEADSEQVTVIFLAGTIVKMKAKDFIYKKRSYRKLQKPKDSWMALRRMELEMSQVELAKKVGIGYKQILSIEKGNNTSKETAMRLGKVLGIPWTRWFEK